jgi:hypothetical protein
MVLSPIRPEPGITGPEIDAVVDQIIAADTA